MEQKGPYSPDLLAPPEVLEKIPTSSLSAQARVLEGFAAVLAGVSSRFTAELEVDLESSLHLIDAELQRRAAAERRSYLRLV